MGKGRPSEPRLEADEVDEAEGEETTDIVESGMVVVAVGMGEGVR